MFKNVVQKLKFIYNFQSGKAFVAFASNDNYEKFEGKFTHFWYKEHPGDLFRGTVIVPLPDPYKDQRNSWIWFHPCFQTSRNVADLNDLYKYLDDEWFDDDVMETDDYRYYSTMPKDQICGEIKSLEQIIYQDCFENFYHLILEGKIELLTSRLKKIYVG